jgi:hypothetical protein
MEQFLDCASFALVSAGIWICLQCVCKVVSMARAVFNELG